MDGAWITTLIEIAVAIGVFLLSGIIWIAIISFILWVEHKMGWW